MTRRILILEDDEIAARMMRLVLASQGHDATCASTGEEGVALARTLLPDVVLTDISLPGRWDGYAVARELCRWIAPKRFLLIAVTGYIEDSDRQAAREAGFDCFLAKPVEVEKIQELFPLLESPGENVFPNGDVRLLRVTA